MFQPPPPGLQLVAPRGPQMMQAPPPEECRPVIGSCFFAILQAAPESGQQQRVAALPPGECRACPVVCPFISIFSAGILISTLRFRTDSFASSAGKLPQNGFASHRFQRFRFGAVSQPLAPGPDEEESDTVQPETGSFDASVVSLHQRLCYLVNFYGRRWRCNICAQVNIVPLLTLSSR
jgi:hypothetical protein